MDRASRADVRVLRERSAARAEGSLSAFYPDQPDGRPAAAMAAEWLITQALEQEERFAWFAERRAIEARRKARIEQLSR